MKTALPLALVLAAGIGAAAFAQPTTPAPAKPPGGMWDNVHWEDDDRRAGPMPKLNSEALRRAGIVKVREVERDDDRIEVEGWDAQGREVDVKLDRTGQRVLSSKVDRDDDDRWED